MAPLASGDPCTRPGTRVRLLDPYFSQTIFFFSDTSQGRCSGLGQPGGDSGADPGDAGGIISLVWLWKRFGIPLEELAPMAEEKET